MRKQFRLKPVGLHHPNQYYIESRYVGFLYWGPWEKFDYYLVSHRELNWYTKDEALQKIKQIQEFDIKNDRHYEENKKHVKKNMIYVD